MELTESESDVGKFSDDRAPSPHASDWFWHPWYAKLLWGLATVYWVGLYALMLAPADRQNIVFANSMISMVFVFNPITVLAGLGRGFLKAKVARGDWIIVPGISPGHTEWLRRERETAYLNPADVRSGYLHQEYLKKFKR